MKYKSLKGNLAFALFAAVALVAFLALPAQAQTMAYGWSYEGGLGPSNYPPGPISAPPGGYWPSEASAVAGLTSYSEQTVPLFSVTTCSSASPVRYYWTPIEDWGHTYVTGREYQMYQQTYPGCVPTPYPSTSEMYVLFGGALRSSYGTSLVDPVPAKEVSASGINADANGLAAISSTLAGVAADGATEIVVRIAAQSAGTTIQLSMADENAVPAAAGSGNALGYLTTLLPSDPAASTAGGQPITVTTVPVASGGAMAFAVYYVPKDFVRDGNSNDPSLATRNVFVAVSVGGAIQLEQPIDIVRPPVAFIHGIWGANGNGSGIMLALVNSGSGLMPHFLNYAQPVTVTSSNPMYVSGSLTVSGANLGFSYAASTVLPELYNAIADYRTNNTLGQPIAVSQADIVAHSMGGDVTRNLPLVAGFAATSNYELGPIHKLITIGTPHLGSPLATQLLMSSNACIQELLAQKGLYAFVSAQVGSGSSYNGGIEDLQGDVNGTPSSLSTALQSIQPSMATISVKIPTGLIAASMTAAQLNALGGSATAGLIRGLCSPDPLAADLTPANWPILLSSQSDAIVPVNSQLAGSTSNTEFPLAGDVHSPGTEVLGFGPPSELDDPTIPTEVLKLLNTPVDQPVFVPLP